MIDTIIAHLAAQDLEHQVLAAAGVLSADDITAHLVFRAGRLAQLDNVRADSDISYAQFRVALNNGASHDVLDALWQRMDLGDPLRARAADDLLPGR